MKVPGGRFLMLVRREFWEHGALWSIPAIIAGVLFLMALGSLLYAQIQPDYGISLSVPINIDDAAEADDIEAGVEAAQATLNVMFSGEPPPRVRMVRSEGGDGSEWLLQINDLDLKQAVHIFGKLAPFEQRRVLLSILFSLALILNAILVAAVVLYALDTLYAERRDRSALFWKSLPISDGTTVAAKAIAALVAAPLLMLLTIAVVHTAILGLWSVVLHFEGERVAVLWQGGAAPWFGYGYLGALLVQQSLWMMPLIGWLFVVSVASAKLPMFTAVLIPFVLVLVEGWLLKTQHLSSLIMERLGGWATGTDDWLGPGVVRLLTGPRGWERISADLDLTQRWADPAVWGGVLLGLFFFWLAAEIRRRRPAV